MPARFPTNNIELRKELERITNDLADHDRIGDQIGRIADLALRFPHSISIAQRAETCQFNCYQYSFNLVNVGRVDERITRGKFPDREFARYLIETQLTEVALEDAGENDHLIYSAEEIQHAGRIREGIVESKWGRGHLWRHQIYEVPSNYGDIVRCFSHMPQTHAIRAFVEWAEGWKQTG